MKGSGFFQAAADAATNATTAGAQQPNVGIVAPPCDDVNGSYVPPPGDSFGCSEPWQWNSDSIALVAVVGSVALVALICALIAYCSRNRNRSSNSALSVANEETPTRLDSAQAALLSSSTADAADYYGSLENGDANDGLPRALGPGQD